MAIQALVTRNETTCRVWGENHEVSVAKALRICTLHGAYASFEEKSKGTIMPGKRADFVVLGADPHRTDPDKIKDRGRSHCDRRADGVQRILTDRGRKLRLG
jgi:predicted amidohydrolase YtcJ